MGQLSEEQEKIEAMSGEIDLRKRECHPATTTKTKATYKKMSSMAKTQNKKKEEEKNKWAWKDELPTPNVTKEDNIPIKTMKDKKYYWCPNHNDGKGKWVIHHPMACENAAPTDGRIPNANVTAFDTFKEVSKSSQDE